MYLFLEIDGVELEVYFEQYVQTTRFCALTLLVEWLKEWKGISSLFVSNFGSILFTVAASLSSMDKLRVAFVRFKEWVLGVSCGLKNQSQRMGGNERPGLDLRPAASGFRPEV